jgi:predicted TIM-barrel fold metal-dependent hydrolase
MVRTGNDQEAAMARLARLTLLSLSVALLLSSPRFGSVSAQTVPIIDLHFHADQAWDVHALVKLFDELGVAAAGNGARGSDEMALKLAQQYPGRFIPYGGNEPIRGFISREGERAYTLQAAAVVEYLGQLETALRDKQFKGIGELVINSTYSRADKASKYPADSPLMRRLWALSANYGVPLSAHMDATPESIQEMERLLALGPPRHLALGAHGMASRCRPFDVATAARGASEPLLRTLRAREHPPNLSGRSDRRRRRAEAGMEGLLEDLPDRFVIGTDVDPATLKTYAEEIGNWRGILAQLSPATAMKLGYGNAERLLKLPSAGKR